MFKFKSRRELYFYEPTEAWLASRDPKTKKEILAWYKKAKSDLDRRLLGPIVKTITAYTIVVNKETKQPIKKAKKPETHEFEGWKLSERDHRIYRAALDRRFQRIKQEYNERVRAKKRKKKHE